MSDSNQFFNAAEAESLSSDLLKLNCTDQPSFAELLMSRSIADELSDIPTEPLFVCEWLIIEFQKILITVMADYEQLSKIITRKACVQQQAIERELCLIDVRANYSRAEYLYRELFRMNAITQQNESNMRVCAANSQRAMQ